MDDKSVPYNLRLRKDHKASAATEGSKGQKQAEREFQEKGGEEVLSLYGCDKCGCSFDLQPSLRSHHCKNNNKSEKEAMENEVDEGLGKDKSLRKRTRKGIPTRAPFF
ncbi:uncharacterized protein LOC111776737 [Cucurbita pepo subsp. pepo]|uniref:uncharacterized protein LOC111776737 n=1 Tax=Cucurbita pepo subsp. pepo TaxID=3664 RepID=UPI000C9D89D7|nr:uncharacterized protein LOC111776737 [Cucurbita pepo subsp. pepo]